MRERTSVSQYAAVIESRVVRHLGSGHHTDVRDASVFVAAPSRTMMRSCQSLVAYQHWNCYARSRTVNVEFFVAIAGTSGMARCAGEGVAATRELTNGGL